MPLKYSFFAPPDNTIFATAGASFYRNTLNYQGALADMGVLATFKRGRASCLMENLRKGN